MRTVNKCIDSESTGSSNCSFGLTSSAALQTRETPPHKGSSSVEEGCCTSASSGTALLFDRPALPLIVDYLQEATSYQALENKVGMLEAESQMREQKLNQNAELLEKLQSPSRILHRPSSIEHQIQSASFDVGTSMRMFTDWLFRAASLHECLPDLIQDYANFLIRISVPVYRLTLCASASPIANEISAFYTWIWQEGDITVRKGPSLSHQEDEPMLRLWQGDERFIRVRSPGNSKTGVQDYLALPVLFMGVCRGGLAWESEAEFSGEHIRFFEESHAALATVLRSYVNDVCIEHMRDHMDEEIAQRTRKLEETNEQLKRANERIERQSGQQLKHFAMMSHEIRTPLNGMIGLTSLLQNTADVLTPEQLETVEMIASSGDLLLRVVNDVLDYSKLTLGMVDICKEVTPLHPLLKQVLDPVHVKARARKITVQTFLDRDLPSYVYTDGRRFQQIVFNLLGNAIKFSRDGGTVELKATKSVAMAGKEHACPRLRIMVKDYGKGIEKSHFDKIFEPFQQANTSVERTHGGTGLGLTVTSRLVKSLGGTIKVDSEFGKWTVFTVDLHLEEATEQSQTGLENESEKLEEVFHVSNSSLLFGRSSDLDLACNAREATWEKGDKPKTLQVIEDDRLDSFKILVAEDNRINQALLYRTLSRLGLKHVEMVEDGSVAVKRCNEETYDLILMDMQMPGMDGIQATRLIREECSNSNATTRIIFVTAHALREYETKARDVGADGFISKPYKITGIKQIVETALQDKELSVK